MASSSSLKHKKGVKDERKPNAMATTFQFETKRKLETIFHIFNVVTALFLFSRSSLFPITLQTLSYYRALFLPLFNDPFYVFLLLNSIILFLYALSGNHSTAKSKDLYDEFLTNSTNIAVRPLVSPNNIPEEKQIVTALDSEPEDKSAMCCPEVVEESPVLNGTVTAVTTTTTTTTQETTTTCSTATTTTTCGNRVSEKKCYRRVRSERYERRVVVAGSGGPELRRMSTGSSGLRRKGRLCHVEQLNKDEFNRAVEDFIAKQKRMLWEEQNQSLKSQNLAF